MTFLAQKTSNFNTNFNAQFQNKKARNKPGLRVAKEFFPKRYA
ncbi:hypothetical protein [Leptospira santarosai]|uniref:Uncharacterized protein n=1 Tax=Leptospira santarosai str. MOR084 TaxID=1049984 RepID=A0A0E2BGK8_9LEPT|nr:hypothetical protein [Leptospira santarosai]EKO34488.1 hypothetical protein LEP1GSC179_3261 [Leptospira santarosai str. MOR084]